jgi:hypothetical protein
VLLSHGSIAQALKHLFQRIDDLTMPIDGCDGGHFLIPIAFPETQGYHLKEGR